MADQERRVDVKENGGVGAGADCDTTPPLEG